MSKSNTLQAALTQNNTRKPLVEEMPAAASKIGNSAGQPSRAGQVNVSAWLHRDYQTSLRMIHATTGRKKQELIAEALNDLFAKHDVPQVRER